MNAFSVQNSELGLDGGTGCIVSDIQGRQREHEVCLGSFEQKIWADSHQQVINIGTLRNCPSKNVLGGPWPGTFQMIAALRQREQFVSERAVSVTNSDCWPINSSVFVGPLEQTDPAFAVYNCCEPHLPALADREWFRWSMFPLWYAVAPKVLKVLRAKTAHQFTEIVALLNGTLCFWIASSRTTRVVGAFLRACLRSSTSQICFAAPFVEIGNRLRGELCPAHLALNH